MIDFTEHDEAEYQRVRVELRRVAFGHYRGDAPAVPPSRHSGPGAIDPPDGSLPVTPAPSSPEPRYQEPCKCLDCPATISPKHGRKRCVKCSKIHRRRCNLEAQSTWRAKARQAAA